MQTLPLHSKEVFELTYKEVAEPNKYRNVTEIVMEARSKAWKASKEMQKAKFGYFTFKFNYCSFKDASGETHKTNHYVIMPLKYKDEVKSGWTASEYDQWANQLPIYQDSLIKDLSSMAADC